MRDPADTAVLRRLAGRVRELADAPEMAGRRALWRRHNALANDRPLVLVFPEGSWREILPDSALACRDPLLREWERQLRMTAFARDRLADDNVVEPWFDVPWVIEEGDFGVAIPQSRTHDLGSFVWDPPLKDLPADLGRLRPRRPRVDRAETARRLELAAALFGDLLPPRLRGRPWWTVGLTRDAAMLVGLERLMELMLEAPAVVHRLMGWLRDEKLAYVGWCEREGLLPRGDEGDYVGSGGVAWTDELARPGRAAGAPAALSELWGFAESQETVGVSPAMFEEFVLPYQLPLLDGFGLNAYGCCEPLERRVRKLFDRIPRLRRVSVAPKADQEALASGIAGRAIFSRKADPVNVCCGFNEPAVRDDLRRTLAVARGRPLEIILKDTHTVQGDADRLARWVRIAREEISRG